MAKECPSWSFLDTGKSLLTKDSKKRVTIRMPPGIFIEDCMILILLTI